MVRIMCFLRSNIAVNSVNINSSSEITINATVAADASAGNRNLRLISSDGSYYQALNFFEVVAQSDPEPEEPESIEDIIIVTDPGDLRVIGSKERKGTINPDKGDTVTIFFKGSGPGKYTLRIFTLLERTRI